MTCLYQHIWIADLHFIRFHQPHDIQTMTQMVPDRDAEMRVKLVSCISCSSVLVDFSDQLGGCLAIWRHGLHSHVTAPFGIFPRVTHITNKPGSKNHRLLFDVVCRSWTLIIFTEVNRISREIIVMTMPMPLFWICSCYHWNLFSRGLVSNNLFIRNSGVYSWGGG